VFDVQRVAGGQIHTHGFHAMIEDELVTNTLEKIDPADLPAQDLGFADRFPRNLEDYPRSQAAFAGRAPEVLQATWRMIREPQGIARTEQSQHAAIWNPDSPRKYLRMHLLGQAGERVISAWNYCRQWSYGWTAVHTRRHGEDLESVFTAILEPYAGEPVIRDLRALAVADNEADALRAVAVQVQTVRGATDVLFADGRPATLRQVGDDMVFAGEFAFVSVLDGALRLATLTGGTRLEHPRVTILPASAQYEGRILASDYDARTFIVDQAWDHPALLAGRVFEVGVPGRMTTYTIASAAPSEHGTAVTVTEASTFYQSRVFEVDAEQQIVVCALGFSQNERAPMPGIDKHWVAMTEDGQHQWRAEYLGDTDGSGRYRFRMDGPVHADQFAGNQGLVLREYGVGDTVRLSTFAALRQVTAGEYALSADTAVQIFWPGAKAIEKQAADGAWQPVTADASDGGLRMQVSAGQLAGGPLLLRVR